MTRKIPASVLAICARMAASRETHASLDNLFLTAGASGDPPDGSKQTKAMAWLRTTNADEQANPLKVLGMIIEGYMDEPLGVSHPFYKEWTADAAAMRAALAQHKLQYATGGRILGSLGSPARSLEEHIRDRDFEAVNAEFDRALQSIDSNPREAVSAASNILEAACKTIIEDEQFDMPAKQDLKSVWNVVRKNFGFDPATVSDQDLQRILTGLLSIIEGIGALRTHASTAHAQGRKPYKLEPRHARLAVHAAHTAALFVLETWEKRKKDR
jgi:hypothetical protein